MNCVELGDALEGTLLRERDPQWLREARRHAEQCPACARLLQLHQLEERLTNLDAVEPSRLFLDTVMNRITAVEADAVVPSQGFSSGMFKYSTMFVGGLLMAVAYVVPSAGQSWLANLRPSVGLFHTVRISDYLAQHPPWAVLLAGVAALIIVLGLVERERQSITRSETIAE